MNTLVVSIFFSPRSRVSAVHLVPLMLLLFCVVIPAFTQWSSDPDVNTAICTATSDQYTPAIASDGSGGAIITWYDYRSAGYSDIYAQRVDVYGVVQWTTDGVAICTAAENQTDPTIIPDGYGGAIITWQDYRASGIGDIYAQRINASGVVQWTAGGVPVCTAADEQGVPVIVSDGSGGAIISWWDYRNGNWDIYAQRINGAGIVQWTANGVAICTADGQQLSAKSASDGTGGAIIAWRDSRGITDDIYAQRVDGSGVVKWTADGVAICSALYPQDRVAIVPDGYGGAVMTWEDSRHETVDIYGQRVDALGAVQWTADGVAICTADMLQDRPALAPDGTGGAIIAWQDYRQTGSITDIYAQHINGSGVVQWTTDGLGICTASDNQNLPALVSDGSGGAYIGWEDGRSGSYDVYVQHIDGAGVIQLTSGGVGISTEAYNAGNLAFVSDDAGGAILTWEDYRSGEGLDIYAQNILPFGPSEQVSLETPANGAIDQTLPPTLQWYRTTDASAYEVIVATDTAFENWVTNQIIYDTTLVVNPNQLDFLTEYFWRVRGVNIVGQAPWSERRQFTTIISPVPSDPVLVAPADGATNQFITLVLSWNQASQATGYTVQVARSSGFKGGSVITASTSDTTAEIGPLSKNTIYYWRVQAYNDVEKSSWSSSWSFKTVNVASQSAPSLLSPRNRATGLPTAVTLQWKASTGATGYRVQVASNAFFEWLLTADTVTTLTSYVVDSLEYGTTYFWRVAAFNAAGRGAWSRASEFTTAVSSKTVPRAMDVIPESFTLGQNYPNPFNPTTALNYGLPVDAHVRLTIHNTLGQTVAVLLQGVQQAGYHDVHWDAGMQAAGVYFYRLDATAISDPGNHFVQTLKMILMK